MLYTVHHTANVMMYKCNNIIWVVRSIDMPPYMTIIRLYLTMADVTLRLSQPCVGNKDCPMSRIAALYVTVCECLFAPWGSHV